MHANFSAQTSVTELGGPPKDSQRLPGTDFLAGVPEEFSRYLVDQDHLHYADEDHEVWRRVTARNFEVFAAMQESIYTPYLDGLYSLALDPHAVPTIDAINERLATVGWTTACVGGYIPTKVYARLIERQIFPLARGVRRLKQLEYSPTPDLVHDIFGHLPLLFCQQHRRYLKELAATMSRAAASPLDHALYEANRLMSALKCDPGFLLDEVAEAEREVDRVQRLLTETPSTLVELSRIFLWSIEFGLIGTKTGYKLHGAGLLSSIRESLSIINDPSRVVDYSIDVIKCDIHFSDLQSQYFVFSGYDKLMQVLTAYQSTMSLPRAEEVRSSGALGRTL